MLDKRMSIREIRRLSDSEISELIARLNEAECWCNKTDKYCMPCQALTYIEQLRTDFAALYDQEERHRKYKTALEKQAVCDWIPEEHWDDPYKLIEEIIKTNQETALDPSVSEDAEKLRDTYKYLYKSGESRWFYDDDGIPLKGAVYAWNGEYCIIDTPEGRYTVKHNEVLPREFRGEFDGNTK